MGIIKKQQQSHSIFMTELKRNTHKNNTRFNKKEQRSKITKINKKIKQSCDALNVPFAHYEIPKNRSLGTSTTKKDFYKPVYNKREFIDSLVKSSDIIVNKVFFVYF